MNISCVICSELFIPEADIYFTQCGHVFHYHCLISWLERSKSCPQCRTRVTEKTLHKVFFNICTETNLDAATLMHNLENAKFSLTLKETEIKKLKEAKHKVKEQNRSLREEIAKLENDERIMQSTMHAFKDQIAYFKSKSKESDRLSAEIVRLKNKLKDMENIEVAINGTRDQVTDLLRNENNSESLALLAATLKKALLDSEGKLRRSDFSLKTARNELSKHKKDYAILESQHADLRRELRQIKIKSEKEKVILKQRILAVKNNANNNNIVVANPDAGSEAFCSPSEADLSHHENEKSHNDQDTSVANATLSVAERVETIVNSDSPYLPVKTNFGSFLDTKFQASTSRLSNKPSTIVSNKGYSIFKTNQTFSADTNRGTKSAEVAYDGLGGSSRDDVFPSPKKHDDQTGLKRIKSRSYISSSKFRKLAPVSSTAKVTEYFNSSQ